MSSSGPTLAQTQVVNYVLPIVATVVTSFRLFIRKRRGILWIDDAWAACAMIFNIGLMICSALYLKGYIFHPQWAKVALYYTLAQCFYGVVWCSRLSILFTVVRLAYYGTQRRILVCIAIIFGVVWAVLFAQVWWTCESDPSWKKQPRPQCNLGRNVAIAQIVTDVLGDTVLILAPFLLIHKATLTPSQRIRVICIFSTSAIITVVSLVHAYYVFTDGELKEAVAAMFEASVSLIIANLSVVVTFCLRMLADEDAISQSALELRSTSIEFGRAEE
ncbi:hypothetical protein DEU56DRAFT_917083 [Suillus clintonianus]|uniref:uncharacterized protein n=1 Tax=Suillus clintonianus TaxID=1904413 RepID=UPI001B883CCE|nr:uncharacterized protein DEU56DRAFT_917083 [Suillus clintonianus]KAG2124209.1 hypothetical protein DEU56DRAFT_917083 [Suillus clintonianus]